MEEKEPEKIEKKTEPSTTKASDDELRQTWKTKPKVSSLLPLPFTTCPAEKLIGKKRGSKISVNTQLDSAVTAEEYRKTEQLLSPIKIDKAKREQAINDLKKRKTIFPHDKRKRIPKPIGGRKEKEEEAKEITPVDSSDHIIGSTLIKSKVRLEDMITLALITNSRYSGPVKKILHAPTLRILAVKEIPLASRESRHNLKDWVSTWQYALNESESLVSVHGTYWNVPEGCASIVTDYLNAGSVENLFDSIGALPEAVIKEIAQGTLKALNEVHAKAKCSYGPLSASNILLNTKAQIKLNIGVTGKLGIKEGQRDTIIEYGYLRRCSEWCYF